MPMLDLAPAAREVVRLLNGVADDQLADPTPCAGTPVAALIDHLMGLSMAFTWAARKTTPVEGDTNRSGRPAAPNTLILTGAHSCRGDCSNWSRRGGTLRRGRA